jgi:hypothetical protein
VTEDKGEMRGIEETGWAKRHPADARRGEPPRRRHPPVSPGDDPRTPGMNTPGQLAGNASASASAMSIPRYW